MKQAALDAFPDFTERLEGKVPTMYRDILGLVTVGYGCLIDPVGLAVIQPFVHRETKLPASRSEIAAEWNTVKAHANPKLHWKYAAKLCNLEMTLTGMIDLLENRLALFESQLKGVFPDWDQWPADAQFATMSMSWAMGAGFTKKFTTWTKCALAQSWLGCAKQCLMRTAGNPGLIPRNKANVRLFTAAAATENPDQLTWRALYG
jgi:GH24 family phage-related lysozyme (muramidase)